MANGNIDGVLIFNRDYCQQINASISKWASRFLMSSTLTLWKESPFFLKAVAASIKKADRKILRPELWIAVAVFGVIVSNWKSMSFETWQSDDQHVYANTIQFIRVLFFLHIIRRASEMKALIEALIEAYVTCSQFSISQHTFEAHLFCSLALEFYS